MRAEPVAAGTSVLASTSFQIPGMCPGNAPLTRYVALGDSYQSREGASGYLPLTDTSENKCYRSANAYPKRLVDRARWHWIWTSEPAAGRKSAICL